MKRAPSLLSITNLPSDYFIWLREDYCSAIVSRAINLIGASRLSKELGVPLKALANIRDGRKPLSVYQWLKIAEITHTPVSVLEKQVIRIRGCKGRPVSLKLPLKASSSLASLIGYSITNSISFHRRGGGVVLVMHYDDEYQKRHIKLASLQVFGVEPRENLSNYLVLPSAAGTILNKVGAPTKEDLRKGYRIPSWIWDWRKDFLISFQSGRRMRVVPSRRSLKLSLRVDSEEDRVLGFLWDVKNLYLSVGVEIRAEPRIEVKEAPSGSEIKYAVLEIGGYRTLLSILELGFTSKKKSLMVEKLVCSAS